MSSVETGQMSAVETGQMSAAETGQMCSVARTNNVMCPVSTHTVDVSEISTVQVADKRSGPKSTEMARNGLWHQVLRIGLWLLAAMFSSLGPVPQPKTTKT